MLLRERYREDGEVKNRTLANLSSWPEAKVEALTAALKGQAPAAGLRGAFEISRSLPHGHVAAVAMIIAAVIDSSSKLAIAYGRRAETAARSLGDVLGLSSCDLRSAASIDFMTRSWVNRQAEAVVASDAR